MMRSGDGVLDAVLADDAGLRSVLREAIGAEHAAVADWRWQPLPSGAGAGTRLFRVSGTADAKGRPVPWKAIVKVLTGDVESFASSSADQDSWDYWKREWHVYRSQWQAALPGPVVPPRCYGTGEGRLEGDDEVIAWIAMEDLGDVQHRLWPHNQWPTVAHQVGVFNGRYVSGEPMPAEPWLATDWIRGFGEQAAPLIPDLEEVCSHPITRRILSRNTVAELLWLWETRNHVYELLHELPRTFCHNDLHNRNLFVRGGTRPDCVAIDWALCGGGVVGQELSAMIGATLIFRGSRPEDGDELEDVCLSAYTAGLRDTCEADPSQARLGYLLSIALRFGLGSIPALLALTTDHQDADLIRRLFECSYEEWIVHSAQAMDFMAERIRRVREELGSPRT